MGDLTPLTSELHDQIAAFILDYRGQRRDPGRMKGAVGEAFPESSMWDYAVAIAQANRRTMLGGWQ